VAASFQLVIARDGSERAIESCVSLITDELGGAVGWVVVFRDVTWRKHLEDQIRQTRKPSAGWLAVWPMHLTT
jgi:PAS domain S-box-containing protein